MDKGRFQGARGGIPETSRHSDNGLEDRFQTAREGIPEEQRSPSPSRRGGSEIRSDGGVESEMKRNPQSGMVDPVRAGVMEECRRGDNGLEDRFKTAREGTEAY